LFIEQLVRRVPVWIAAFIALNGWSELHHYALAQVAQTKFSGPMQSVFAGAIQIVTLVVTWKLARRD